MGNSQSRGERSHQILSQLRLRRHAAAQDGNEAPNTEGGEQNVLRGETAGEVTAPSEPESNLADGLRISFETADALAHAGRVARDLRILGHDTFSSTEAAVQQAHPPNQPPDENAMPNGTGAAGPASPDSYSPRDTHGSDEPYVNGLTNGELEHESGAEHNSFPDESGAHGGAGDDALPNRHDALENGTSDEESSQ